MGAEPWRQGRGRKQDTPLEFPEDRASPGDKVQNHTLPASKEPAYNSGDLGSIPGSGRSPGEGDGNPLQYSCLKNSMDRGAWQATVHTVDGIAKSWTQLSD